MKHYYERYWEHTELSPDTDPYATTRLRILRKVVPRGTRRALDVGAGEGHLVAALAAEGVSTSGMDISETAVRAAAERYPGCRFEVHSAEDLPWPVEPGSLDLVVAFEVIEHLVEPRRLVAGARASLRPGGHVALTTPASRTPQERGNRPDRVRPSLRRRRLSPSLLQRRRSAATPARRRVHGRAVRPLRTIARRSCRSLRLGGATLTEFGRIEFTGEGR